MLEARNAKARLSPTPAPGIADTASRAREAEPLERAALDILGALLWLGVSQCPLRLLLPGVES